MYTNLQFNCRRLTSSALAGEEDEEQEGGVKEEVEEERILLGPADEEDKADKTPLKGSIKSVRLIDRGLGQFNLKVNVIVTFKMHFSVYLFIPSFLSFIPSFL